MTGRAPSLAEGHLVSWYGDDFTGATAVMEVLTFAGLPSVLFFDIPTAAQLQQFAGYRGIGIAGIARSKSPDWMDVNLPPVFDALAALKTPICHYKICSTLDSAPHVGSIGRACEIAITGLGGDWHPLLVAAPAIERYQVFGNLFAGVAGVPYRLDRHPVMSRHPVTPMTEADVCKHLSLQTALAFGLVSVLDLAGDASAALGRERDAGAQIVAIDCMDDETLAAAGRLIWEQRQDQVFAIGSQGVEYALIAYWRSAGLLEDAKSPAHPGKVERMAVVSGSCSPITAAQIQRAQSQGFEPIRINPALAVDARTWKAEQENATTQALRCLSEGRDPMVFTASGPDDPSSTAYRAAIQSSGKAEDEVNEAVGSGLGQILRSVVERAGLTRAVIAGGDTSSHGASTLGIYALTALAPVAPGGSLCRAHSDNASLSQFEIALKGGQMGGPDYFETVKNGGITA